MANVRARNRPGVRALGLSLLLVLPAVVCDATDQTVASGGPSGRPRIGLVLAGGGAKGGAHVGVIKVLEQMRVPIDCVAGTSMGALVGAGYAAGLPARDLELFVEGIDWKAVVGGIGRRPLEPIEQKRSRIEASSVVALGVQDGQIITPGGIANTSGIDDLLRTFVARARTVADFNQLPIPYRAVATDMVSGEMVVLDHGDLATAMRASMAIPGAFAPVVWGDYILSDGGQVRNLPVDVARQTCADVVIVVNLVEPPVPREKLMRSAQLIARSMEVMLQANVREQLATLTDRDVRIDVPMGDIRSADFDRVPEAIPLGEAAARKVADRLAAYALPEAEYAAWRSKVTMRQEVEVRIAAIRFEGLQWVDEDYLRTATRIRPGDKVDVGAISDDAMRMSALEDIDSVAYRLEGGTADKTLVWMPKESSVGPRVLRPSLGMYGGGAGDLRFLLGAQYVSHWLNDRGGQWRASLQVGYESLAATSWYQPFDVTQRFFVEPGIFASRSVEDLYVDGDRVAVYRVIDTGGSVDLGVNLGRAGQVRVGYLSTERRVQLQTGIGNLPDISQRIPDAEARDAGLSAEAMYDSRDTDTFARHGFAAAVQYLGSDESLGADRNWSRIEAAFRKGVPFGRNAIWLSLAGGSDVGGDRLPADRAFSLGGPQTLPAYQFDELRVRGYWLAEATVLWRLVDLVPVKSQAIYAGLGLQAAGLHDRVDRVADGNVYGAGAVLGGPTPIGTFTVGLGASADSWGIWLSLGRPVGNGSLLDAGLFR